MLVDNDVYINRYVADGSTASFPIAFPFLEASHIEVYTRGEDGEDILVDPSMYTITGAGVEAGGELTFNTLPVAGTVIAITRNVPITQLYAYTELDNFPAESHENALAKLTMICQELKESGTRAIKVPVTSSQTGDQYMAAVKADMAAAVEAAQDAAEDAAESRDDAAQILVHCQEIADSIVVSVNSVLKAATMTISVPVASGTTLSLPNDEDGEQIKYHVGGHNLLMYYNGAVMFPGEQYNEQGTQGEASGTVKLLQELRAGDTLLVQVLGLDASALVDGESITYDPDTGLSVDLEGLADYVEPAVREQVAEAVSEDLQLYQKVNTKNWDSATDFQVGALIKGSDGNVYVALQASGPSTAAVDPTSGLSHIWKNIVYGGLVSQSISWHVDALNGDDDNDGLSDQTAFKTFSPVIERINQYRTHQPSINVYGNHVYEIPAVPRNDADGRTDGILVWGGGAAPHIHGIERSVGDGYPTIKFIFCVTGTTPETVTKTSRYYTKGYNTQSVGPRFYMSHCNFDHIKIDANYNGIYFEGCALSLSNVEFKIPCRVIGGNLSADSCTFFGEKYVAGGNEYNPFGSGVNFALGLYSTIAMLTDTTINASDGKTYCVSVNSGAICRISGSFVTEAQSATGGCLVHATTGQVKINISPSGDQTNFEYGIRAGALSEVSFGSSAQYTAWSAVGNGIYNSGNNSFSIAGKPFLKYSATPIFNETLDADATATEANPYTIDLSGASDHLYGATLVIETPLTTSIPITVKAVFSGGTARVSLASGFSTTTNYDLVFTAENDNGLGKVTLNRSTHGAGYVSMGSWARNTLPVFIGSNGKVTKIQLYTGSVLPSGTKLTVYGTQVS